MGGSVLILCDLLNGLYKEKVPAGNPSGSFHSPPPLTQGRLWVAARECGRYICPAAGGDGNGNLRKTE